MRLLTALMVLATASQAQTAACFNPPGAPPPPPPPAGSIPSATYTPAQPFVETWANDTQWENALVQAPAGAMSNVLHSLNANDGSMGSSWLRFGDGGFTSNGFNVAGPLLDQRFNFTANFKARLRTPGGVRPDNFIGLGILYTAESNYGGGLVSYRWGEGDTYTQLSVANAANIQNNAVFTVDNSWDTSAGKTTRIDGGAWKGGGSPNGVAVGFPMSLWWGAATAAQTVDVGAITTTGRHLWGAIDNYGWFRWIQSTNSAILAAGDGVGDLGGVTGIPQSGSKVGAVLTATGTASLQDWYLISTGAVTPAFWDYDELRIFIVNPRANQLKIYVRFLVDGTSVFTSGGFDVDVVPTMTAATGTNVATGTLKLNLGGMGLNASTGIYLDVRGHTDPAWGNWRSQPRLGGAWISFAPL